MKLMIGNLWDYTDKADVLIFTGNSFIKRNGELVMGRGMALEVKKRYPFVPKLIGELIRSYPNPRKYGLAILENLKLPFKIGSFQVKYHFRDPANMELIRYSTSLLREYAEKNQHLTVFLNFPGIGYGRLKRLEGEIKRIISELPDNVYIWKLPE